jgi:hypothetical protein
MRWHRFPKLLATAVVSVMGFSALVACEGARDDETSDKKIAASDKKVAALSGDGFTVDIPGDPKRSTLTVQTPKGPIRGTIYVADLGDEAYAILESRMPHKAKPDLDGAIQGAAAKVHGDVEDTKQLTYHGFPARDARITSAQDENGNQGTVFVRVIGVNDRFYQLEGLRRGADVTSPPELYAKFLSSLKIG